MPAALQRNGERRHAAQRALDRARDRPRVEDVGTQVEAVVDARHHQRRLGREHFVDRDVHAISRSAIHGIGVWGDELATQRPPQRQRVANGARFGLRRHNNHLAQWRERLRQRRNPRRKISVVVRQKNRSHRCSEL